MKALTNINARSIADAVAAASAAAARGRAFAFSGGGTDVLQQIKDGTNQADVIINLRTVREARAVSVSPTDTRIGGLITLTELASHAALSAPWAVLREAAASVGTPQIRNVATELLTGVRMPTLAAGVVSTYLKITSVASDRSRTFSARDIPSRCRSRPGRRTRDCPRVTAGQEWPQGPMTSAVVERADASGTGVSCATMH
jgi:CO/xanthine dehydrogenase FAD-binding subunit